MGVVSSMQSRGRIVSGLVTCALSLIGACSEQPKQSAAVDLGSATSAPLASTAPQAAPSVAVSVYDRQLTQPLERVWALAESLGADLKSGKAAQGKKEFEAAAERLRKAAKARPEIKVMAGSASQDIFYVSGTNLSIDLEYFKALGVNFVEPTEEAKKATGGWFESLSWENVDKYKADVILMDDRSSAIQPADITEATWKQLPAVKAGQVIARSTEPILSYDKCVAPVEALAEAIEKAKKVS